jgi:glycosyltransferase involved in cell wall biosynthesis
MGGAEHWILSLLQHLDPERIACSGVSMVIGPWHGAQVDVEMCRRAERLAPVVGDRSLSCFRSENGLTNAVPCESEWDTLRWLCDRSDILISWGLPHLREWMTSLQFDGQIVVVSHNTLDSTVGPLASWKNDRVHFAAVSRIAGDAFFGAPVTILLNGGDVVRTEVTVPLAETRRLWGIRDGERTIGHVGRLSWEKNPLAPARAALELGPGWRAVYIGTGVSERDVRRQVGELMSDAVFAGKYEQVGNALAALDVFVLASWYEGFSLAMTEAWLAGTPVVATRVGGVPEIEEAYGSLVVPVPMDPTPRQLACAVAEAVSEGNRERVARAQQVAWQHFTDRAMGRRWTEYLLSLPRD